MQLIYYTGFGKSFLVHASVDMLKHGLGLQGQQSPRQEVPMNQDDPLMLFVVGWAMLFVFLIIVAGLAKLAGGYIAPWPETLGGVAIISCVLSAATLIFAWRPGE